MTLCSNVTNNNSIVLVPRVPCGVRHVKRAVLGQLGGKGPCSVIIMTRNVRASKQGHTTRCVTRRVRCRANVRAHRAILNCVRQNNSPAPFSHGLSAHVNKRTARLVTGKRFKQVVALGKGRVTSTPLRRVTNGLGLIARSGSLIIRKHQVKVYFNWFFL